MRPAHATRLNVCELVLGLVAVFVASGCVDNTSITGVRGSVRPNPVIESNGVLSVDGIRDLGIPSPWESSVGTAINDAGQVAGFSTGGGYPGIPWSWQNGFFTMLPTGQYQMGRALGINELGEIAGNNYVSGGKAVFRWN